MSEEQNRMQAEAEWADDVYAGAERDRRAAERRADAAERKLAALVRAIDVSMANGTAVDYAVRDALDAARRDVA